MKDDKCETCEHESDSGQEYCGSCGSGVESNWSEAGWILEKKVKRLKLALEIIIDFSKAGISTEHAVLETAKKALIDIGEEYRGTGIQKVGENGR